MGHSPLVNWTLRFSLWVNKDQMAHGNAIGLSWEAQQCDAVIIGTQPPANFFKKGDHFLLHRHCPQPPHNIRMCVNQDSPPVSKAICILGQISIHPWYLDYFPQVIQLCLLHKGCVVWIQEFLKLFLPLPNNIVVNVSSSLPLFKTVWVSLLSRLMAFQDLFEVNWKSVSLNPLCF